MGSFAETYNDPKSGGRELKLARRAQGGYIQVAPLLITMFYDVMGKLLKQKPMLEM